MSLTKLEFGELWKNENEEEVFKGIVDELENLFCLAQDRDKYIN